MFLRNMFNSIKCKYYTKKIKNTAKKVKGEFWIGGKTFVTPHTTLGDNVNFNGMSMYGNGEIIIGDNFHSGINCQILTSFHNYEGDMIPYDKTYIDKNVIIGDNVWLGNNVIILGGVTIGEGAIIQAGSVVSKSIPSYSIAGGHPAVPFKQRDVEHYKKLKNENKIY